MTATIAFGLEVLADEPTPSPISRDGQRIEWEQTRTLLLSDGSTAYGCLHCDYVSRNVLSIRPHLSKHNRRQKHNDAIGEHSLAALVDQLKRLDEITTDRDKWKARALSAEKSLRAIREAISGGR